MELAELKKLLKVLQSYGVTHYTTPELALQLQPNEASPQTEATLPGNAPAEPELSQEELLYYSVPGMTPAASPEEGGNS